MKAAVVNDFSRPPRYEDVREPVATRNDEVVVEVLAAGLHPRVRSQAGGSHYTSTGELPLIPGIDAVVRDPAGKLRYAILDDTSHGTMAERTLIEKLRDVHQDFSERWSSRSALLRYEFQPETKSAIGHAGQND